MEAERTEVQRELQELQEKAEGHREELSTDSESSGSWRTDSEEPEGVQRGGGPPWSWSWRGRVWRGRRR